MSPFDQLRILIRYGDVSGEEAQRLVLKCIGRVPAAERAKAHERLDSAIVGIGLARVMNIKPDLETDQFLEVLAAIEARAIRTA